jgi:DNA-binding LacI/PurR family transcriptional regulator
LFFGHEDRTESIVRFIRHPSEDTPRGHTKDAIERMIVGRGYKVGNKLPTYRDLATHFGIAVRTIERVMRQLADEGTVQLLHGKGAFVRKVPAGSGRLTEIGLVYPASRIHLMETEYLNQILTGAIAACDAYQIDLQIVSLRTAEEHSEPLPARDIALRVDGVILLGVLNEPYISQFAGEAMPLVLIDAQSPSPVHSITVDNASAVDQTMDHLYALGHRRIAYADARSQDDLAGGEPTRVESADTRERREAYLAALRRLKTDYERVFPDTGNESSRLQTLVSSLRGDRQRPTAILAYDEGIAGQFCQVLPSAGLQVPRDISVAAAVGTRGGTVVGSQLVTCGIAGFRDMGWKAVEALRRQATGRRAHKHGMERVACTLQAGTTTAAPARRWAPERCEIRHTGPVQ